jgi:hypothetical protein
MDFGVLLAQAGRLVWRQKALWVIGLLPVLTHLFTAVLQTIFLHTVRDDLLPLLQDPARFTNPQTWLLLPETWAGLVNGRFLIVGLLWLFVGLLLFWLVLTLAEATVIALTLAAEAGRRLTARDALRLGSRWMGRFIAIDALVFFPWFLIALVAMLLALLALLVTMVLSVQGTALETIGVVLLAGLSCVALLAGLLVLVGFLSVRFRSLAFRDTAVFGHSARHSVRHTWQVIRPRLADTLLLVGLLWGVQYIAGLLISLVAVPLGLITAVPLLLDLSAPIAAGSWLMGLGTAVILAIPRAFLFVYLAVAWTLGYRQLSGRQE